MDLHIKNAILSFPSLFEKSGPSGSTRLTYNADFILDDDSEVYIVVDEGGKKRKVLVTDVREQVIEAVAQPIFKARTAQVLKQLPWDRISYRDGNNRAGSDGKVYAGYEDRHFFKASNGKVQPSLRDRDNTPLAQNDGKLYSGARVNVIIDVYAMADKTKQGVHASLRGVQFFAHGDPLGGKPPAGDDEFESYDSDDEFVEEFAESGDDLA